jgi:hypothetical protein
MSDDVRHALFRSQMRLPMGCFTAINAVSSLEIQNDVIFNSDFRFVGGTKFQVYAFRSDFSCQLIVLLYERK